MPRLKIRSCVFIFLLCVTQLSLYAATQGKPDRTSSRGTISITLDIPESTRLIANPSSEGVCLHVLDSAIRENSHFYNVVGLSRMLTVENENNQRIFDDAVKTLHLKNFYGMDPTKENNCIIPTKIQPELVNQKSQSILLMLIVE